jgi:hypothetical protein
VHAVAEWSAPSTRKNEMMTNDDFANRELSIEELEAIAGGGWFHSFVHGVEHVASEVWHAVTSPSGGAVLGIIGGITGIFGSPLQWGRQNQPPVIND